MALRAGQINGTGNLTRDHDLGAFGYSLYRDLPGAGGVMSGLAVSSGSLAIGRALLGVTRTAVTPNEQFLIHVENTAALSIDTTGTKKIWLEAIAARVNDPSLNTASDGTGIAQVATGADWPATPHVRLASTVGGVITDERVFLKTAEEIGRGGSDYADATGSSNAYAVTFKVAPTSYPTGMRLSFKANHTNTGAATLNVNGLGAKALKISDGTTDPAAGFILSGALLEVRYDGTNFVILSAAYTGNAIASQAEAEAGVDNVKLMTPLRTKQQVDVRLAAEHNWQKVPTSYSVSISGDSGVPLQTAYTTVFHPAKGGMVNFVGNSGSSNPSANPFGLQVSDDGVSYSTAFSLTGASSDRADGLGACYMVRPGQYVRGFCTKGYAYGAPSVTMFVQELL